MSQEKKLEGCIRAHLKPGQELPEPLRGRLRKRKIKHVKLQFRAGTGTTFRG